MNSSHNGCRTICRAVLAAAVVLLALAACAKAMPTPTPTLSPTPTPTATPAPTAPASPTATPTPVPSPSRLQRVLGMAPLNFADQPVNFADYSGSRQVTGLGEVRSIEDLRQGLANLTRLFEGLPYHGTLAAYAANLHDLMGLDLIAFDLGMWVDEPGISQPNFMVLEGLRSKGEIVSKLPGLEYKQAEHGGTTYYWLYEEPKIDLRHPLRPFQYFLNRIAFVDDRLLFAPTDEGIFKLLDVQQGKAPSLQESRPHSALAAALGEGLLGGIFLTRGWVVDTRHQPWHQLGDKPVAELDAYIMGPDAWGVLSPYTHALFGYRVQGATEETVVALYYPDPDAAERDAGELKKRWNTFRGLGLEEEIAATRSCSPFSTTVRRGTDSSVLVGSCPAVSGEKPSREPNLWLHLLWMGQLQFLVPDLEELKEDSSVGVGDSLGVRDRYGNSIPLDDALAVMSVAAKQVLIDAGVSPGDCVTVYTDWKWTSPDRYEPMDEAS